ncbi:hypothetical protein ACH5RR_010798 [Cinchona calisaya]|uniref:Uncharacterized protein n=1 Tax=Cinchona calisaya TaxID=153742 RepID=A0ABD3AK10_9GENT
MSNEYNVVVGYLSALISVSFLDIGSGTRILDGMMKVCLQFCWKIENQDSNENTVELEQVAESFLFLHWVFFAGFDFVRNSIRNQTLRSSRLAGSQRAPYLRHFLLRLNFNSFFEATARGVFGVVRP